MSNRVFNTHVGLASYFLHIVKLDTAHALLISTDILLIFCVFHYYKFKLRFKSYVLLEEYPA